MSFICRHRLPLFPAICLLIAAEAGCLWHREAAVSPKTIVSRQLCRQGIAAMERERWDDAEPLLAKAVDVCPEAFDARSRYADLLWRRNRRAEAIRQMLEAIRLAPEDAALRVAYGEMQLALGNLEAAAEAANLAIDMQPNLPGAWALRGRWMRREGKPQEALWDLHRAEGLDPENVSYPLEIADLYLGLNEPDRALAAVEGLSRKWSTQEEPPDVLLLKGRVYLAMKRYGDAADSYLLASSRGAADSDTFYRLAEAQMLAGRINEAVAAAQKALSMDPDHAGSRHLLAQMGIAGGPFLR